MAVFKLMQNNSLKFYANTMEGMLGGENWIIDILDTYHNHLQLVSHPQLQFNNENKSNALELHFYVYEQSGVYTKDKNES